MVACCIAVAAWGCSKSESSSGATKGDDEQSESAAEGAKPESSKPTSPETKDSNAAAAAKPAEPTEPAATPTNPSAAEEREDDHAAKRMVEVEIFGSVKGRPESGKLYIYGAEGDCLADDAKILEKVPGGDTFMIEVFAPWGVKVTVCAAVDPGNGKPPVLYGKWKEPMLAEGEGEVMFRDVVIELAKHKPHTFPAVQRPVFK